MTAHWESTLNGISNRESSYADFMQPLETQLQKLIANSSSGSVNSLRGVTAKQTSAKKKFAKRSKKKTSKKKSTSGSGSSKSGGRKSGAN